jgi:hypothetical protein
LQGLIVAGYGFIDCEFFIRFVLYIFCEAKQLTALFFIKRLSVFWVKNKKIDLSCQQKCFNQKLFGLSAIPSPCSGAASIPQPFTSKSFFIFYYAIDDAFFIIFEQTQSF